MGPYPGMSMFKRFAPLNARNLLYMQAEIVDLEQQLEILAVDDETGTEVSHHDFAVKALKLRESILDEDGDHGDQWEKVLEIRERLKEYSKDCQSHV
jgi:hypothetical protein